MKTHYDTLGVPFGADYETIKAAYRKALKVYHPDLHEGDAAAELHSRRIIDAHAVLKDPEQRERYDEYVLTQGKQRRRLFLITMLITGGSVFAGSAVFLGVAHTPTAMLVASSDRPPSTGDVGRAPAHEHTRVAKADIPLIVAVPSRREQEPVPSFVKGAPVPPRSVAIGATEIAASASTETFAPDPSPGGSNDSAPSAIAAPAPQESFEAPASEAAAGTVFEEHDRAPAGSAPGDDAYAPSSASIAPAPKETLAEPFVAVTPPPSAEQSAPSAPLEKGWEDIARRGNIAEIWKFIQDRPATPEAVIAAKRLEELIGTNDDIASLTALRATATGDIAAKVQARMDALAADELMTGTLPAETAEQLRAEAAPVEPMSGPDPQQQTAIDPAAAIMPRDPKEHVKKGLASFKIGKHTLAIASFNNAILLDPGNPRYYLHRAAAFERKGDLDAALADYDAAVKLDQTNIATFHGRGLLRRRRGEAERALADLDRAIRLSFSDAKIYRDRGVIWYGMGRYNRAIADFSRAIALNPNFASAYAHRGQAFQKKGDPVTAAINFEKAVNRDPSIVKTHRDLLRARTEAEDAIQKAPQASR